MAVSISFMRWLLSFAWSITEAAFSLAVFALPAFLSI